MCGPYYTEMKKVKSRSLKVTNFETLKYPKNLLQIGIARELMGAKNELLPPSSTVITRYARHTVSCHSAKYPALQHPAAQRAQPTAAK